MKGPARFKYFEDNWPTDKGAWFPGESVFYRQKSLFKDFGDSSWMALLLYGIKDEMPTPEKAKMVEKIWSLSSSFPDPRLWNNRVAALSGSARSTGSLAVAAATGVTEATIYGSRPVFLGAEFLREMSDRSAKGEMLEELVIARLKKDRHLPGFGRPIISKDERIGPLLQEAEALGFGSGRFVELVKSIEEILRKKRYKIKSNVAIYCAALFSDLGYNPRQSYMIAVLAFSAGIVPCYLDAVEKPEGVLFPIPCQAIDYSGFEKRRLKL